MSRKLLAAFIFVCILLLAATIAIAILAVRINESSAKSEVEGNAEPASCDDIAIVGAGISGSYAAWRLRDKGLKISLYEYSNRIGGQCFTVQLPDIPDVNIDMGALQFEPSWHQLLNRTIHELGLETEDLSKAGDGGSLYYLRGKHMSYSELAAKAPYNIPKHMEMDYSKLYWQIYLNNTLESSRDRTLTDENKQYIKTTDGTELYKLSWDVFSGKYLDKETTSYIVDATGYDNEFEGASASHFVPKSEDSKWRTARFKTISKGFQAVPTRMVEQFLNASAKHTFHRNFHLRSIKRNQEGNYLLKFLPTETKAGITSDLQRVAKRSMCARKVLLAIPKLGLESLDWDVLNSDPIKDILRNSLVSVNSMKMFFGYGSTWWRNMGLYSNKIISDTPLRATYDYSNLQSKTTPKAVYMTAYPDLSNEYWKHTQAFGNPVQGTGDKSIEMTDMSVDITRNFLSQIYNVSINDIPKPKSAVMAIWDQYPFGAAWYSWAPGYKLEEVGSTMLKPSSTDDVYIISNSFSPNSFWANNAIETVEKALKHIK